MSGTLRPDDNDFAQLLLFENIDGGDGANAQNFMQNLNDMLSRDQHRASIKRIKSENEETIGNLSPAVKQVFTKIKNQLEDQSHPLVMIISSFQKEFIADTLEQLTKIRGDRRFTLRKRTIHGPGNTESEVEEIFYGD